MSTTERKRIPDALYMVKAASEPEAFKRVVRTYVLQHIETTEHAVELLRDLGKVNPPAFREALQIVGTDRLATLNDQLRTLERQAAAIEGRMAAALPKPARAAKKKLLKRAQPRA